MAYMDEMALEREKSKQAMIAGKQPLLGDNTTAMLHELGVSLGIVPKGTPVSQTAQLAASLIGPPKSVKVDEAKPLQVQPLVGRTTATLQQPPQSDDSVGASILGSLNNATGSALKRILKDQQAQKLPAAPTMPPEANANIRAMSTRGRVPHSPEGATYKDDLKYLNDHGGHYSVLKDGKIVSVPVGTEGNYKQLDPELAARLRSAGQAYEKETGKPPQYGEFSRGPDVQKIYHDKVVATGKGMAAAPGNSNHQHGSAGDVPPGGFRDWLYAGNQDKHGLVFPHKGDAPHIQVNPANKQSFSNPGGALPASPTRPTAGPGAGAGSSQTLVEQRKPIAEYFDKNPTAKDQMAAVALAEDGQSSQGRIAVHEANSNRITAAGRPITDILDPKYYQPMHDGSGKYEAALKRVQSDPQLRAQLHAEIDQANKQGTNYAKLATDFGTGKVAANAKTNSTHTGQVGGNDFFIKDRNPIDHGAGTVASVQKWKANTENAMKQGAQNAPASAPPPSTPAPQASAQPAPQASPQPPAVPEAPPVAAPQVTPQGEATPKPITPAPAATTAAPAAVAPAPAAPQVSSSPPPAKPAPQVNPAHAFLDTSVYELAKKSSASDAAQVKTFLGDKVTLREAMKHPIYGGMAASKAKENLDKVGVTPQQFDQAVKEGPPKPGKRSDIPADPSQQKVRYAQADTGTMSDASPELPADASSTAAAAGPVGAGQEGVAPAAQEPSASAAVETVPLPPERPNVQGVLDQARREYPVLKNQDYGYVENPQPGQGYLEHWPAGEEGAPGSPRPAGLPMDKPGLEIRDPSTRPIDVAGDITSHQLIHTDPTVKATYERFQKSLTPEQNTRLEEQYAHAQANEGETRPYADWRKASGEPAYFRGYPFQQWPAEEHEKMYTPEQRADLDKMMGYLKGQPQAPQAPQPATPQQTPISPGIAKALEDAVKPADAGPGAPPPPAEALPVLPAQPAAPMPPGTGGGLSLAPAGLSSIPTGALAGGAPGSQGGSIAMAGMLPPIENSTFSTPLLDSTAASAPGGGMGLSPIPFQTLGSWGWGGGGNIGAGFDWGGGGGGVSMPMLGGYE